MLFTFEARAEYVLNRYKYPILDIEGPNVKDSNASTKGYLALGKYPRKISLKNIITSCLIFTFNIKIRKEEEKNTYSNHHFIPNKGSS